MVPEVRLSGVDNEPLGVVSLMEALRMAGDLDVDLVEIAATAILERAAALDRAVRVGVRRPPSPWDLEWYSQSNTTGVPSRMRWGG